MRLATHLLCLAVAALAATACTKDNPAYCGSDPCPIDGPTPIDATSGCNTNPSLCTATESCVANECLDCNTTADHESAECTVAGLPVCRADHGCRACAADAECDSGVCEAGSCIAAADVAYVATNGTATSVCAQAAPCQRLAQALTTTKALIVVGPGAYDAGNAEIDINNRNATIRATGAVFSRTMMGSLVTVRGSSQVTFLGGDFDASGDGGGDPAISTTGGTTLTLDRVTIHNSDQNGITAAGNLAIRRSTIKNNNGDGVAMSGATKTFELSQTTVIRSGAAGVRVNAMTLTVLNNFIIKNGSNAAVSALKIDGIGMPAASRIEFNTIAGNRADGATNGGGVSCAAATAVIKNSIVYDNTGVGQVNGCTVRFSTVQGATPDVPNGIIDIVPGFKATTNDNFHLMAGSPVAAKADPTTSLTGAVDFDDEARPQPAATAADLGADEIP